MGVLGNRWPVTAPSGGTLAEWLPAAASHDVTLCAGSGAVPGRRNAKPRRWAGASGGAGLVVGDNLRRAVPMVALLGAALLLAADLLGRLLIHPYEVPSSNLLSIAGCAVFLAVLLHGRAKWS